MRIWIAWGSKRGGTEAVARMLAEDLRASGYDVTARSAGDLRKVRDVDAVIVGGALYANRWHRAARRFVARNEDLLRTVPTWFFSSGPLDSSAANGEIAPTRQVQILMERVGVLGHKTFGGRLEPDARGFPASAMAKKHAGDWRDPTMIHAWGAELARALPFAKPATPITQPGRSFARLALHGVAGWALCAIAITALPWLVPSTIAVTTNLMLAPLIFAGIARHYFAARGAREPVATAAAFVAIVGILDAVIVAGFAGEHERLRSGPGFWIPLALIFAATSTVGMLASFPAAAGHTKASRANDNQRTR